MGDHKVLLFPPAELPAAWRFIPEPRLRMKWHPGEFVRRVAVATKQRSTSPLRASPFAFALTPLSSSQALILLASPWARRGVRVGSICLCDGHWCQAPRGMEGEERRLVWSGRGADVSELSCGTPNGAELKMRQG